MQLGSMFICNCNIALHVSDAFCVHLQEHRNCRSSLWWVTWAGWGIQQGVQGRWHRPWTPCWIPHPAHVTHQRLLLQFLSAPEDGRKKRPKHVELYCSYKLPSCITLVLLYILTYDARKPKHKINYFLFEDGRGSMQNFPVLSVGTTTVKNCRHSPSSSTICPYRITIDKRGFMYLVVKSYQNEKIHTSAFPSHSQ